MNNRKKNQFFLQSIVKNSKWKIKDKESSVLNNLHFNDQ